MITFAYSANEALRCAMEYAGLAKDDVRVTRLVAKDGLYEIALCTSYQMYEFYVDTATGEVLGINAIPTMDLEFLYEESGKTLAAGLSA